ncbi:MAG: restriction endonuclease subunit S [Cyanobacteriota bacterium]
MSFPRYPAYKPSGVEWLGEVPEHWEALRLRFATQLNPSKQEAKELGDQKMVSFLPMEAIGEHGSIRLEQEKEVGECLSGYTYFRDGDVCVAKITPCFENGKGAILRDLKGGIGFGTTELIVTRPVKEKITSEFLDYLFRSQTFRRLGESEMYGAGGQKRVPDSFVRDFTSALPSIEEQSQVTRFLDRETAKIDALIAEQQRLIELLQEKRQAVISHAVTKGLNPNAPMKDSGVEWLGEVPEDWTGCRFKHCLLGLTDAEHKTCPDYVDSEYLIIRTSNVRDGALVLDGAKYTDVDGYKEWTERCTPKAGDIVFTREAPAGEACIIPEGITACLGQRTVLMHPSPSKVIPGYLVSSIYSGAARAFIQNLSQGSTVSHLNMSEIGNMPIALPPLEEQLHVNEYTRDESRKFHDLIQQAQTSIMLFQERRSALISAAVTGQIDVRGLVEAEVGEQ